MSNGSTTYDVASIDQESGERTGENAVVEGHETRLPVLEDVDHPLVPDFNHTYATRKIQGVVDLKLVSFIIEDPDFSTLLEGEPSVGKNAIYNVLAANSNWPLVRVNFGVDTTYEKLVGRYAPAGQKETVEEGVRRDEAVSNLADRLQKYDNLSEEEAVGKAEKRLPNSPIFTWRDGLLTRAVKNGWMFVADEINAADGQTTMPLHSVSEDRDSRHLTIEETSEVIEPHSNFRFCATMNPPSFAGTNEMNSAFKSRFYPVKFDYLPKKAEKAVLIERTDIVENIGEDATDKILDEAENLRNQEQSGNDILTKITLRDLIKVGNLTEIMGPREAMKTVFLGVADETDTDSIEDNINAIQF